MSFCWEEASGKCGVTWPKFSANWAVEGLGAAQYVVRHGVDSTYKKRVLWRFNCLVILHS